jgi:hypothetical protein
MKEQNDFLVLGPMVRASTLPLRLAALEFGADRVYSEESNKLFILNLLRMLQIYFTVCLYSASMESN